MAADARLRQRGGRSREQHTDERVVADPIAPPAPGRSVESTRAGQQGRAGNGAGRTALSRVGTMAHVAEHYQRPGWFTTNVFNRVVALLTRVGVSVYGSRVLRGASPASGDRTR